MDAVSTINDLSAVQPRPGRTCDAASIRRELSRVYRAARMGAIPTSEATRLAYVLKLTLDASLLAFRQSRSKRLLAGMERLEERLRLGHSVDREAAMLMEAVRAEREGGDE
jgi:hypothetical protein